MYALYLNKCTHYIAIPGLNLTEFQGGEIAPLLHRSHSFDSEDLNCTVSAINLSNNKLTSLPHLLTLPSVRTLDLRDNIIGRGKTTKQYCSIALLIST